MSDSTDYSNLVAPIIRRYSGDPTCLLQILRDVQDLEGRVSPQAIDAIAALLDLPRARVKGMAGFYSFLHTDRPARYRDNITDRMQGNAETVEYLCGKLLVERGHVSEDARST